jgi:hypothetical protein
VPPTIWPAGAQGGTSAGSTGAALSFVSCLRLFGRTPRYLRAFFVDSQVRYGLNASGVPGGAIANSPFSTPELSQ